MASEIEIYNRALSRIGIDQFISDPAENSKAGSLYRLWYASCVATCLRDFPWNFAARVVALAQLSGDLLPGWAYKYAYPVDCLMARVVADSRGMRSTLSTFSQSDVYLDAQYGAYSNIGQAPVPFAIMSEAPTSTTVRRVIVTDQSEAYLFYTAKIDDPNQFDASFVTALEWMIAAEIAGPFLGAPTGPQVAKSAGEQYRNAIISAKAQTLNETGRDIRPDSPAIACR